MPQPQTQASVLGLAQSPNPFGLLPPGTCSKADNVVIRRKGIMSPLPGNDKISSNDGESNLQETSTQVPVKIFGNWNAPYFAAIEKDHLAYVGNKIRFSDESDGYTTVALGNPNASPISRTLQFDATLTHATFSRSRHIFTEHSAPLAVEATSSTAHGQPRVVGLPPPVGITTLTQTAVVAPLIGTLSAGNYQAYRAMFRRIKDNFTLDSAPCAIRVIQNATVGTVHVSATVVWDQNVDPILTGDYVLLFKCVQQSSAAALGDVYQLCASVQLSASQASSGSITLEDNVQDDDRGETLYTNDVQQGADQANFMPPPAVDVVTYQDTTFYVTKNSWPTWTFTIPGAFSNSLTTTTDRTTGIGERLVTGDFTASNAVIRNILSSNLTGVTVGQELTQVAATTYVGIYITAIAPDDLNPGRFKITLSSSTTWGGSGTKAAIFSDTITFKQYKDGGLIATDIFRMDGVFGNLVQIGRLANCHGMRYLQNVPIDESSSSRQGYEFTIWCAVTGICDYFTATATNGANYVPYTPVDANGASTFTSIQDTQRNKVFFSKTQLPEAVPPSNFFPVGAETVLKLWPLQSAVMALCTDGLWRITGSGNDWSVNQVDRTLTLISADAVGALDNQMYAWVTDGLAQIDEQGSNTISIDAIGPALKSYAQQFSGYHGQIPTFEWNATLTGDNFRKEVWLNLNIAAAGSSTFYTSYIYNNETQQFTSQSATQMTVITYWSANQSTVYADATDHYYVPDDTNWQNADVQFNPIVAEDMAILHQWVDLNWFFDDCAIGGLADATVCGLQLTFDGANLPLNYILTPTPSEMQNIHYWIPRFCAVKNKLILGFKTKTTGVASSTFFNLYGFKVRYRAASETLKK